tara:strand:- start:1915 stop:2322 length:408 start_codon:yes stop_codon:yes gene_type:complete
LQQARLKFYCLSYYRGNPNESLVLNQTQRFFHFQLLFACSCLIPILITTGQIITSSSRITRISEVKNYSTDEKRDIYSTFATEDQNDHGLPIDPFDLMNRLQQAESMDDATTPSDALDEALNAFENLDYESTQNE